MKKATVYDIAPQWQPDLEQAQQAMADRAFVECSLSQEFSVGWVPPREPNAPHLESVNGHWLAKLQIETRTVPAQAIKKAVDAKAAEIETTQGRQPGKKERRQLKEDCRLELLPTIPSKTDSVRVWIDHKTRKLVLETTVSTKLDAVITELVKSLTDFAVTPLKTDIAAKTAMSTWLATGEGPEGFSLGKDCELRASDDSGTAIRYKRHPLVNDEIVGHIAKGMVPATLAMCWDDRVSFELTDKLHLKKITFSNDVLKSYGDRKAADDFDAEATILTSELTLVIEGLLKSLTLGSEDTADQAQARAALVD